MPSGFGIADTSATKLGIVLKCDTMGSVEAISALLSKLKLPDVELKLIHAGVGSINKQDVLVAITGSKLILGFEVGLSPKLEQWIKEKGVEVRLYNVIYKLVDDLMDISRRVGPVEPEETVTGKCKVIATFKTDKGVIIGCEVQEGTVQVGKTFRIVTAMGPVHSARIDSLQVEKNQVKEAKQGQQVGVKVTGYMGAKIGDFIECFETTASKKKVWSPQGKIVHKEMSN